MSAELEQLLIPAVEAVGCELLGIEYRPHVKGGLLRLYIDKPDGVLVEDCERVSHQVSGLLDVEDPVPGRYTLEVSSPGMDRPLFNVAQMAGFIGQKVRVQTNRPVEDRRKFSGELTFAEQDRIRVKVDGVEYEIPFELVSKARLVPQFDNGSQGK